MAETTLRVSSVIKRLVAEIVTGYSPEKIILFGSFAYGEPDENSDVDLLIVKKDPEPKKQDRWVTIKNLLWDLRLGVPVSPLVISPGELKVKLDEGHYFIEEIIERGIVVYEKRE